MNKQNRFFRHKGLAGALAMVAVILAVAFAAGYHLPDAAAKKGFYNLFWGAKVTVQMRVLSAPTFFSIKK